jgi:hypothetical protein
MWALKTFNFFDEDTNTLFAYLTTEDVTKLDGYQTIQCRKNGGHG